LGSLLLVPVPSTPSQYRALVSLLLEKEPETVPGPVPSTRCASPAMVPSALVVIETPPPVTTLLAEPQSAVAITRELAAGAAVLALRTVVMEGLA
jgi:hypothetical protein